MSIVFTVLSSALTAVTDKFWLCVKSSKKVYLAI